MWTLHEYFQWVVKQAWSVSVVGDQLEESWQRSRRLKQFYVLGIKMFLVMLIYKFNRSWRSVELRMIYLLMFF